LEYAHRLLSQGRVVEANRLLLSLDDESAQAAEPHARFLLYRLLGQAARSEGRLDEASFYYEKCLDAADTEDMRSGALEGQAITAAAQGRPRRAVRLFEEAAAAALAAGDAVGHAMVLQNHAVVVVRHGLGGAEDLLRRALALPELPDEQRGIISDNLSVELTRQGRYDEAAVLAQEAARTLSAVGAFYDAFKAWMNLANASRGAGRLPESAAAFSRAHDLAQRLNSDVDEEHYGRLYDERVKQIEARTHAVLVEQAAAKSAERSAWPTWLDIGFNAQLGTDLFKQAEERFEAGDLAGAETALLRAESHWEHLQAVHCLPQVWNLLGLVYLYAGADERAREVLSRSRHLSQTLGDPWREGHALSHLAMAADRFGIGEENQLTLLLRAHALGRFWMRRRLGTAASKVPDDMITGDGGVIDGKLAQICARYSAWELADAYIGRSLKLVEQVDNENLSYRLAVRLSIRLQILQSSGRTEAVPEILERLAALTESRPDAQTVMAAHTAGGRLRFGAGERSHELLGQLTAACDAHEEVRRQALDLGPLSDFQTFVDPPYAEAVEVALALGLAERAFALAERARARSLLDAVRHAQVLVDSTDADASLAREQELWRRQRELRDELSVRHEAEETDARVRRLIIAEQQLEEVQQELGAVWARLAAEHPEVRIHRSAVPITSVEAARLLDRSGASALVEFWTGYESLHAFVLEPGRAEPALMTLGSHDRLGLRQCADDVRALLAARSPQAQTEALDALVRSPLHQALRSVVANAGGSGTSVLVVPHGLLHGVPLHLSPDGGPDHPGPSGPPLRYLPSASLLRTGNGLWHRDGAVVVGGHAGDGPAGAPGTLTFHRSECAEVADRLGGTANVDGTATGEWLESTVASVDRLSLVHLACHAIFDERRPERSGLLLAGPTGSEVVSTERLAAIDWSGALVTLSACGSGRHGLRQGDELVGLGHALLSAGASGLIVSQWPVRDRDTALLMSMFYEALAAEPIWDAGVVADVLSRAQRRMASLTAADLIDWACTRLESPARTIDMDRLSHAALALAHHTAGTPDEDLLLSLSTIDIRQRHLRTAAAGAGYRRRVFPAAAAWGAFVFYGA
jgi:CHAT domain-containing protein